jgi:aldehyde:ferredoxin oxidoreductase
MISRNIKHFIYAIFVPIFYFVAAVAYRQYKKTELEINLKNIIKRKIKDAEEREKVWKTCSYCPTGCKKWIERGVSGLVTSSEPRFRKENLKYWSKHYKMVFLLFKNKVK